MLNIVKKECKTAPKKECQGQPGRTIKVSQKGLSRPTMEGKVREECQAVPVSWGESQGCKGQRKVKSAGRNVKASTYQVLQVLRRAQASQVGRGCHGDQADLAVPHRADQAVQVPLSHSRITMMHTVPEDSDTVSVHCETP